MFLPIGQNFQPELEPWRGPPTGYEAPYYQVQLHQVNEQAGMSDINSPRTQGKFRTDVAYQGRRFSVTTGGIMVTTSMSVQYL